MFHSVCYALSILLIVPCVFLVLAASCALTDLFSPGGRRESSTWGGHGGGLRGRRTWGTPQRDHQQHSELCWPNLAGWLPFQVLDSCGPLFRACTKLKWILIQWSLVNQLKEQRFTKDSRGGRLLTLGPQFVICKLLCPSGQWVLSNVSRQKYDVSM